MKRIPIQEMGDFLIVSIRVDMDDHLAMALQEDLSRRIAKCHYKGVLIDISSVEVIDAFLGRTLSDISAIARVLDSTIVVTGMRPAVAITLVEEGLTLPGIKTALDVESGMNLLRATPATR